MRAEHIYVVYAGMKLGILTEVDSDCLETKRRREKYEHSENYVRMNYVNLIVSVTMVKSEGRWCTVHALHTTHKMSVGNSQRNISLGRPTYYV